MGLLLKIFGLCVIVVIVSSLGSLLEMGLFWKAIVFCILIIIVSRLMKNDKRPVLIDGTVEPGFEEVLETFR